AHARRIVETESGVGLGRIALAAVGTFVEGPPADEGGTRALRRELAIRGVAREAVVVAPVAHPGRARSAVRVAEAGRPVGGRVLADAAHAGGRGVEAGDGYLHAFRGRIEAGRRWGRGRGDVGQRDLVGERVARRNRIFERCERRLSQCRGGRGK